LCLRLYLSVSRIYAYLKKVVDQFGEICRTVECATVNKRLEFGHYQIQLCFTEFSAKKETYCEINNFERI